MALSLRSSPLIQKLQRFITLSALVISGLPATQAYAGSDANQVHLMDLTVAMSGVPSASVPLVAVLNTRDRSSIEEFLIDMPWWAERLGATDRHVSRSSLTQSEFITPSIADFSGNCLSILAFQTLPGFSPTQGGTIQFHFRVAPSAGGGCRVLQVQAQRQRDWDRDGYANYGALAVGSSQWLTGMTVRIREENDVKVVSGLQLSETLSGDRSSRTIQLSRLARGACPN
jgi:hypothetical protein